MNSKKALEKIKDIVGDELFAKLIEELSGETVYFSADAKWLDKEDRNEKLRQDYYSGKYEISNLAQKYNLSISHVYKIIQRH